MHVSLITLYEAQMEKGLRGTRPDVCTEKKGATSSHVTVFLEQYQPYRDRFDASLPPSYKKFFKNEHEKNCFIGIFMPSDGGSEIDTLPSVPMRWMANSCFIHLATFLPIWHHKTEIEPDAFFFFSIKTE